eukprot:1161633-Pelagomonas_calceolata.AAC.2
MLDTLPLSEQALYHNSPVSPDMLDTLPLSEQALYHNSLVSPDMLDTATLRTSPVSQLPCITGYARPLSDPEWRFGGENIVHAVADLVGCPQLWTVKLIFATKAKFQGWGHPVQ